MTAPGPAPAAGGVAPDPASIAARLDEAARTATAVDQVAAAAGVDAAGAYVIQDALIARRLERGERLVGLKMGLTSQAKMAQMGVDEVIWGRLTDAMHIEDGAGVDISSYIHPRVEPEVAFLMAREPEPDEPLGDVLAAVAAVAPALELIDSRYANFRFTLPDVIADNTSAAGFVVGDWRPPPAGLDNLGVLLEVDGRVEQVGSTAAILGDPRRALRRAVRLAGRHGVRPRAGWIVLAGAATAAIPLPPGAHVRATVEKLGTASLRTGPGGRR